MAKRKFAPGKVFYICNKSIEGKDIFPCENDRWRLLQAFYFFNNENRFFNLFYELEKRKDLLPLDILKEHSKAEDNKCEPLVFIMAYCLKDDGFYLLLEEKEEGGISKFMQRVNTGYTKYFNNKYKREGHLFRGKFKDKEVIDEDELKHSLIYINVIEPGRNVKTGAEKKTNNPEELLEFAVNYFWSTHQVYINKREAVIADKGKIGTIFPSPKEYLSFAGNVIYGREGLYS